MGELSAIQSQQLPQLILGLSCPHGQRKPYNVLSPTNLLHGLLLIRRIIKFLWIF